MRSLKEAPDLYLDELRQELAISTGVWGSIPTVWRTLRRTGYTMKKVCDPNIVSYIYLHLIQLSRIALERNADIRRNFAARIGTYEPEKLVFVDESAVDRRAMYRGKAWAIRGREAHRKTFFCCGRQ